jgi:plastocyanin
MTARRALIIAALLVGWAGCGGNSSNSTLPTPSPIPTPGGGGSTADVTITIAGMNGSQSFSPNPGPLKAGQRVAWHNADSMTHTATANGGAFDTGNIAPGGTSAPVTIATTGTVSYSCRIHPSMTGSLTITP